MIRDERRCLYLPTTHDMRTEEGREEVVPKKKEANTRGVMSRLIRIWIWYVIAK